MNSIEFMVRRRVGAGSMGLVGTIVVDGSELADTNGVPPPVDLLLSELRDRSRRVHVRICGCGEPGCWLLVARVSRSSGRVVWDDWREGVEAEDDESPGDEVSLPPLEFNASRYDAAVAHLAERVDAWQ